MEIRVSIQVSNMETMFEFIMCRGSGVTLSKCNVPINVKVSCR